MKPSEVFVVDLYIQTTNQKGATTTFVVQTTTNKCLHTEAPGAGNLFGYHQRTIPSAILFQYSCHILQPVSFTIKSDTFKFHTQFLIIRYQFQSNCKRLTVGKAEWQFLVICLVV